METSAVHEVTFGLERVRWLQHVLWGNPLWQYLVFFGYILAAVFLSKLADVLMSKWLKTLTARTKATWDDRLVELLHKPLKLIVFLLLMHLGIAPMSKPDWLQTYLSHGFGILVAIAVTYVVLKFIDLGYELAGQRFKQRDPRAQQPILVLLRKATKIFVIVTAVLVTADNNGIKVSGILASFGLTGLAVALAAQETLSNLIGSIVILMDRPFFLGDRVRIGTDEGVVEHIGVRSTVLRTAEGDVITLPNRNVVNTPVRNFSKTTEQLTQPKSA